MIELNKSVLGRDTVRKFFLRLFSTYKNKGPEVVDKAGRKYIKKIYAEVNSDTMLDPFWHNHFYGLNSAIKEIYRDW